MIEDLLTEAELRQGPSGIPRSTYSFRHTYATFRLSEGIDVYFLAEQMGTSVAMIEDHYGHVSPVKNADRILHGMTGWQPIAAEPEPEVPSKGRKASGGRAAARQPRDSPQRPARPDPRP
jgi:integrase